MVPGKTSCLDVDRIPMDSNSTLQGIMGHRRIAIGDCLLQQCPWVPRIGSVHRSASVRTPVSTGKNVGPNAVMGRGLVPSHSTSVIPSVLYMFLILLVYGTSERS